MLQAALFCRLSRKRSSGEASCAATAKPANRKMAAFAALFAPAGCLQQLLISYRGARPG